MGGPLVALFLLGPPAMAQDRIELKGVVGTAGFLDSPTDYRPVVGGALRLRLSRVFSVEPELLYMRESSRDEAYSFQTALIREFRGGTDVRPYLVAGAGVLHSHFKFPGASKKSSPRTSSPAAVESACGFVSATECGSARRFGLDGSRLFAPPSASAARFPEQ